MSNATSKVRSNAARFYSSLLRLYPETFRRAFGAQMLQTFDDWHDDVALANGRVGFSSWLALITDEVRNIAGQRMAAFDMNDRQKSLGLLVALATLFGLLTVSVAPRGARTPSGLTNGTQPATIESRIFAR
jgi:hypothetical protein